MSLLWTAVTYPTSLDTYYNPAARNVGAGTGYMLDWVDDVQANAPNILAASILAIETKLGITGGELSGIGDISFDGIAASAGTNTLWVDTTPTPNRLIYSDSAGTDIDLSDHSSMDNLTGVDDHTQYALLAGRAGGQTLIGDTAASGDLTLQSTSDATRGYVIASDLLQCGVGAELVARGVTPGNDSIWVNSGLSPSRLMFTDDASTDLNLSDHNTLDNLTTGDVHTQYAILAGRAGGQTLVGGSAASEDLILESTSDGTKGDIYLRDNTYAQGNLDTALVTHDSADLTISTTTSGNVVVDSINDIIFDDQYKTGWTADLKLSTANADWTGYEALFGEVPLMNAINQAGTLTKTFDDTVTSSSIAGAGGTWTREIDIDIITSGLFEYLVLTETVGASADTDLELYDADPAGAGVLIYSATSLDISVNPYTDNDVWWGEVQAAGSLWAKITNNGVGAATYTLRVRLRDDNTTTFTE